VQQSKYVVGRYPTGLDSGSRTRRSWRLLSLADQVVNFLCEIWHPQDIPNVFMTLLHAHVPVEGNFYASYPAQASSHNTQLLSPISSAQLSPMTSWLRSMRTGQQRDCTAGTQCNIVPIKGFVREVLCRSLTSRTVVQIALATLRAFVPRFWNS
jgi:hypothetical protein